MFKTNGDAALWNRGGGKTGKAATAGSPARTDKAGAACNAMLAAALSMTLAVLPGGMAAFAETPDASSMQAQAGAEGQVVRIASSENALDNAPADGVSDKALTINPGKLESDGGNTYYWPNLEIIAKDPAERIYSATIQFTSAISDSDEINVAASGNFTILNANKHGNKTVNNAQGATAAEWQAYLRNNLSVQLANADRTANIRITLSYSHSDRTVEYLAETDHYYELVSPGSAVAWTTAYAQAAQKEYLGMQGYLATITSEEENDFISSLVSADCWLGATCDPNYIKEWAPGISSAAQYYYWVTGPERGTRVPIARHPDIPGYSNWANGPAGQEPNNSQGVEFYMHMKASGGQWNDYANGYHAAISYLVEYGGMPDDAVGGASGDDVTIDIVLDPKGKTLSTSLGSTQVEVGGTLSITVNVNGEVLPADKVTNTFYIEDPSQPDGWRKLDDGELGADGMPIHAGNYKVESSATYIDDDGVEQSYTPGSSKFTIAPKAIDVSVSGGNEVLVTKTYDGTDSFDLSGIDLSGRVLEGADVSLGATSVSVSDADKSSAGEKVLTLGGASLSGDDASDYRLTGLNGDGSLNVKAQILPRDLVVSTSTNIQRGHVGSALRGLELGSNLAVRDAGSDAAWLENELAPCDGELDGDGNVLSTILGDEALVAVDGDGNRLDVDRPQRGVYEVEAHYANVNPADGVASLSARPSNVVQIDDHKYDIGNYILTIRPATIAITSRNTGGAAAPGDGSGDGDVDNPGDGSGDSGSGVTFAPIDTETDVRLDPSSSGTVGGDPYLEYEAGRPVNILDMIQVRPEGEDGWSDWMSGSGSGSDNPDGPNGSGGPDDPTNPDDPNNPGGSDATNPDGSGSGDQNGGTVPGYGDGSGSGNGSGSDDTTPQLPEDVKVVVVDDCGNQVDPTDITDPGTYEVTVSVKDPDTGEFTVVETMTFHIVDTSITDTDLIYRDVAKDHWGHGYIFDIGPAVINGAFNPSDVALGYMAGYAGTKDFGPHNGIIRGDAAIVIWRMAGCPDVDQARASSGADGVAAYMTGFTDCDADLTAYYNKAISWCAANGIVTGYEGTGEYRPQSHITREEFASIIARYAAFKGKDVASAEADLSQYPDIHNVSDWAAPNMQYVVANGIMTGKGTDEGTALGTHGILDPQAHVTRAEVAKMAYMEQPCRL